MSLLTSAWNSDLQAYGPFYTEEEFKLFQTTADATMETSRFVIHRCTICRAIIVTVGDRDFETCAVCGMPT